MADTPNGAKQLTRSNTASCGKGAAKKKGEQYSWWKPFEADPCKLEYAGQPVAQRVFEELRHRLKGMGYLLV